MRPGDNKAGFQQFLVFRLGGQELAVTGSSVREVIRAKGASLKAVAGRGSVRYELEAHGRWIPVVSMAPALGLRDTAVGPRSCLILLYYPDVALVVNSVSRMESLAPSLIHADRVKLGDKWRPLVDASAIAARAIADGYFLRAG